MVEDTGGSHVSMKKVGPFTGITCAKRAVSRTDLQPGGEKASQHNLTRRAGILNF